MGGKWLCGGAFALAGAFFLRRGFRTLRGKLWPVTKVDPRDINKDCVTLEDLQGRWRMVSVGKNGNFAPPQMFINTRIDLLIEGTSFTVFTNDERNKVGHFQLDSTQNPTHYDEHFTEGDTGTNLCIVRVRSGEIEFCQAEEGDPRPKNFSEKRTDGATIARFRRTA